MKTSELLGIIMQAFVDLNNGGFTSPKHSRAECIRDAISLWKGDFTPYTVGQFLLDNSGNLAQYCSWSRGLFEQYAPHFGLKVVSEPMLIVGFKLEDVEDPEFRKAYFPECPTCGDEDHPHGGPDCPTCGRG